MTRRTRQRQLSLPRVLTRETGAAFAALAIWLLSLLAPMHLVSRMTSELRLAGYELSGDWSLCLPSGQTDDDGRPITLCPGKTACGGGLLPEGAGTPEQIAAAADPVLPVLASQHHAHRILKGSVQPRAPPMPRHH